MDPRPVVHCILAIMLPDGDYIVKATADGEVLTLEQAVDYVRFGWECMPDPFDQEELARWEQINRMNAPRWWGKRQRPQTNDE